MLHWSPTKAPFSGVGGGVGGGIEQLNRGAGKEERKEGYHNSGSQQSSMSIWISTHSPVAVSSIRTPTEHDLPSRREGEKGEKLEFKVPVIYLAEF